MKQAIIYRTVDGVWNALFLADSTVKFGGNPDADVLDVAKGFIKEFPDTQFGIRSRDLAPAARYIYGPTVWLNKEATAA